MTQKLVTEEGWFGILELSYLRAYGEIQDKIRDVYPDATEDQMDKALTKISEVILKKSGYEYES